MTGSFLAAQMDRRTAKPFPGRSPNPFLTLVSQGRGMPGAAALLPPLREGRVEMPGSAAFLPRPRRGPTQRRSARKSPGIRAGLCRETALLGSSTMEGFSFATKGLLTGRGRSRGMHRARRPAQGGCGLHFPRPLPQSRGQERRAGATLWRCAAGRTPGRSTTSPGKPPRLRRGAFRGWWGAALCRGAPSAQPQRGSSGWEQGGSVHRASGEEKPESTSPWFPTCSSPPVVNQ